MLLITSYTKYCVGHCLFVCLCAVYLEFNGFEYI